VVRAASRLAYALNILQLSGFALAHAIAALR
jgi:hypothetical protein